MASYRLLKHKDFDRTAEHLPPAIRRKAIWAQVLLGTRGRTPSVKGTTGLNARWRRTPVQGNHYYMWWIPRSESMLSANDTKDNQSILVHSIRHHDETDNPIEPGSLNDYEELPVSLLDPRYDEQHFVSYELSSYQSNGGDSSGDNSNNDALSLATIKGLPGSGKTISLFYLVKDLVNQPGNGKILYVTYTSRLKRAATEFIYAQSEHVRNRVDIRTLNEIESEITKIHTHVEPFTELPEFCRFLDLQSPATLGPWRKYSQTLFTEIRAHLLGKAFPIGYNVPEGRVGLNIVDANSYAASRNLAPHVAESAYSLAERAHNGRFFRDQKAARHALDLLLRGKVPLWLTHVDALIVDEVQDLTLVQIALLGELARARINSKPHTPFAFAISGDESQIVQPSGFDWGTTKDLLGERLGTWPAEFEFQHQRRSPRNLAQLIDNTWNFYAHLPKRYRPSARRQTFVDAESESGENGVLYLCTLPDNPEKQRYTNIGTTAASMSQSSSWGMLLEELADKPGRVLIDLTETLQQILQAAFVETSSDGWESNSSEVLFLPREIKGLERPTVLVHGLNRSYEQALHLCDDLVNAESGGDIPRFEARRLFDEIRVALSRSTDRLILLEPPDSPVLQELQIDQIEGVVSIPWDELLDMLQAEDLSELELVEGYLDEVDDLIERSRWQQAYKRNRRALDIATQLGDGALQRDAHEQYIQIHLHQAEALQARGKWKEAYDKNRHATKLADELGDPVVQDTVTAQLELLRDEVAQQAQSQIKQAQGSYLKKQYKQSYDVAHAARALSKMVLDSTGIDSADDLIADTCWQWAYQVLGGITLKSKKQQKQLLNLEHGIELLDEAAEIMQRLSNESGAKAIQILSERYRTIPPKQHLTDDEVSSILHYATQYMAIMKPLNASDEVYGYIQHWIEEAFDNLGNRTPHYYPWTVAAQELATISEYKSYDEHLWELEHRFTIYNEQPDESVKEYWGEHTAAEQRNIALFNAFILHENGEHEQASLAWEALGNLEFAIENARESGDMERAYQLLRQAKLPIPEELSTAVKTLRLMEQLTHKSEGLREAEREALVEEMIALSERVADGGLGSA